MRNDINIGDSVADVWYVKSTPIRLGFITRFMTDHDIFPYEVSWSDGTKTFYGLEEIICMKHDYIKLKKLYVT